ncbi:MAG: SatD family protein [Ignavibacteriaceae bacterium]
MNRIALIGDIVSSKQIKSRSLIQKNLNNLFKKLNNKDKQMASPLTITLGDEFQAIYNSADSIFYKIWQIMLAVYPEKIRFSLGIGEITTRINSKQAIGMDGPAFHYARKGLEELKASSYLLNVISDFHPYLKLVKHNLFLLSNISYNWKKTRLEILTAMYEGLSVKQISNKLKVTDKAVYKNIDAGSLFIVKELLTEVEQYFNQILKEK